MYYFHLLSAHGNICKCTLLNISQYCTLTRVIGYLYVLHQHSNRDLAVIALEKLIETSGNGRQIFTAIRCLLRIKLTIMDASPKDKLLAFEYNYPSHEFENQCACIFVRPSLKSMLQHLKRVQSLLPTITPSSRQNEANWLLKVAWNLALQCTNHYKEMAQFFVICYHLSSHLPCDASVLRRQKSCQLMAAAAYVQVARASESKDDKVVVNFVL